jgi:hypothetical protein
MRRKTAYVRNGQLKSVLYGAATVALLAYAVPKIPRLEHGLGGTFSFLWITFAGLAVSANVYFAVAADKERSYMLEMQTARREHAISSVPAETVEQTRARG